MRFFAGVVLAATMVASCSGERPTKEQLGKLLFLDPNLSQPAGQSCADCHAPGFAFRDPEYFSTSPGVVPGRFGPRNAPTVLYAAYVPALHRDASGQWKGGLFWDGRAGTLAEQAGAPLLNPLEMNNPDKASVVDRVRRADYAAAFREVYGPGALDSADTGFANISDALAAFERTPALLPFSSKYDHYLAGRVELSEAERRGLSVFEQHCASCHPNRPAADGTPPLFTNFEYANLGIPKQASSHFYGQAPPFNPDGDRYVDHGLMTTVGDSAQDGKFRVPTLRNVLRTAPYGHNGYFTNLPLFIDFLNSRDEGSREVGTCTRTSASARCAWPDPEVAATIDPRIGRLGMSPRDMGNLLAFLATLTDK